MEGMGSKSPYGGQLLAVGQLVGETVGFPTFSLYIIYMPHSDFDPHLGSTDPVQINAYILEELPSIKERMDDVEQRLNKIESKKTMRFPKIFNTGETFTTHNPMDVNQKPQKGSKADYGEPTKIHSKGINIKVGGKKSKRRKSSRSKKSRKSRK